MRLWLRVLYDSIYTKKTRKFLQCELETEFLSDPDNRFIDMIADHFGEDPDDFRERIKKSLNQAEIS